MVSRTSQPQFTPGKDPVPILQEAGWAPGPVWMGGKSRPHRDSILDRPARSQSLYRLNYPAHEVAYLRIIIIIHNMTYIEQAFSRRVNNECLVSDPYALKNQLNYCEFRGKIIINSK